MSNNDVVIKMKQKQYESTVIEFVQQQKGHFVVVSDDQTFLAVLRTVLNKHLALTQPDILSWVPEAGQVLRVLRDMESAGHSVILFMERAMGGRDLSFLVRQLKEAYPKIYIVILATDVEKQRIMFLHEMGTDNFIAKPVSANTLIEKLAFTIKPQTKLGQVIDIAKSMLQHGQPEKAQQLARQILEMKPGSAAGLMLLGDSEKCMGNMNAAKEAYEAAGSNADMYLEPLRKLAELAEEMGDDPSRLGYLERLDKLSPLNTDRKVSMGELHFQMGNDEKAIALFEAAVNQVTRDALGQIGAISMRIASIYADRDPLRSELFLRRALDAKGKFLNRDDVKTFNQLGISLRQQGKWRDAITEYEKALKLAPDDENLYYNMGMAFAEGKDFRQARICMGKALQIMPEMPRSSSGMAYNFGVIFLQAGVRDQARACLEIALTLDPEMDVAKAALKKLGL